MLARRLHGSGAVDERGLEVRRRFEDRREQDAAAAADVDQARQAAEVIGGDDVARLLLGAARHRGLERGLLLGMGGEVLEEGRAVGALEGRPAVAHRVEQARHARRSRPCRERGASPAIGARHSPSGVSEKRPSLLLDDVLEREPAQDAGECSGVGTTAAASSAPVSGPSASASATPSSDAT